MAAAGCLAGKVDPQSQRKHRIIPPTSNKITGVLQLGGSSCFLDSNTLQDILDAPLPVFEVLQICALRFRHRLLSAGHRPAQTAV